MKFLIACQDDPFGPPEVLERHEGTEADAKRALRQWMNDDDRFTREEHDGLVIIGIYGDDGGSDVFAVIKKGAK